MIRQIVSKLRRKPAAKPATALMEVRTGEVLEVRLAHPPPEAVRSSPTLIERLTPSVARKRLKRGDLI